MIDEKICDLVVKSENGSRLAVINGIDEFGYFLDHHDMYLKIFKTE